MFLIFISMMISFMFMMLKHPITLSMMIFIQTIILSSICGMLTTMFWFSYMLFLVMIGGLLVIFLYMTNVASNEKFKPSKKMLFMLLIPLMLTPFYLNMDKLLIYMNVSMWNLTSNMNIEMILMKFYNYPSNYIIIMMMIYLLLTMVMSVKITNMKKGALRQKH